MIRYSLNMQERQSQAYEGDHQIGYCQFDQEDGVWIIRTTYVLEEYGGQGIAKQLVLLIEQEAQKRGLQLKSTCWYASKVLKL